MSVCSLTTRLSSGVAAKTVIPYLMMWYGRVLWSTAADLALRRQGPLASRSVASFRGQGPVTPPAFSAPDTCPECEVKHGATPLDGGPDPSRRRVCLFR